MKKILFFISSLFIAVNSMANMTVLDTSYVDVVYRYTVIDTIKQQKKEIMDVTLVGKNFVKYQSWGAILVDSAWVEKYGEIRNCNNNEERRFYNALSKQFKPHITILIKDLSAKSLFYKEFIGDFLYYYEPLPEFKWVISEDNTKELLGYQCRMATVDFRGRHWTAWFAEDLAIPFGPWKFEGLPGMILEMYDDSGTHRFEATEIINNRCEIKKPTQEYIDTYYFETTRERFNKSKMEYCLDPVTKLVSNGIMTNPTDSEGNPKAAVRRRQFYNPLELE